ncbi:MAG: Mur ligase family protein [Polyangiaceae bacterium]
MAANLAHALERLYARIPLGMRLGLGPMADAVAAAGHPERAYGTIHVAGTNGKGSTCAWVERMARAQGLRTGLYTSPHLERFAERIRVDGEPLAESALAPLLDDVLARTPDLSFFETATLAAFEAFRAAKVDVAVIEVGLGGRLDATNVLERPVATAVTRIAFDHQDKLGDTLERIAAEKAAIAKSGVPMILGPLEAGPRRVIEEFAKRAGAPVVDVANDTTFDPWLDAAPLALPGAHQRDNAKVACAIARTAGYGERAIREGLARASWPGRLERIPFRGIPFLLDAAHNPDGARALAAHLDGLGIDPSRVGLVFGTLADKAWPEMLDLLAPRARMRVYAPPDLVPGTGRSAAPLASMAERHAGDVAADVFQAIDRACQGDGSPPELVVVAGSMYLLGAVRAALAGRSKDGGVAL